MYTNKNIWVGVMILTIKIITINWLILKKVKHEKLFRKDTKYDYLIPISYNTKNIKLGKGSAIFIHLTKTIKALGCGALKKRIF